MKNIEEKIEEKQEKKVGEGVKFERIRSWYSRPF